MKIKKEVKIGIFGVCILIATYWGISFLKGVDILSSHDTYVIYFEKSDNIEISSPVLLKGIKVGNVTDVEIPDIHKDIKVTIAVQRKYKLPDNSVAVIANKSMLGGKAIVLEIGDSPNMLANGSEMKGTIDNNMTEQIDDVKNKLMGAVDRLSVTLDGVNKLLNDENIQNLGKTIENIKNVSGNINNIVVAQSGKLDDITTNLTAVTNDFKEMSPRLKQTMANLSVISDSLSVSLPRLTTQANRTIAELDMTIAAINERKGSVGKLFYDPALYDNLTSATNNLSLLLEDLKAHPGRYVSFSLFGRKNK